MDTPVFFLAHDYSAENTGLPHGIHTLNYTQKSSEIALKLHDLAGFAWVDSGAKQATDNRFEFVTALPDETFASNRFNDPQAWITAAADALNQTENNGSGWGLLIGHLNYDTAATQHGIHRKNQRASVVGLYRWVVVIDHLARSARLIYDWDIEETTLNFLLETLNTPESRSAALMADDDTTFNLTTSFQAEISKNDYLNAIERIKNYILAGDCYQVNYAQRFSAEFTGDPWEAYLKLRSRFAGPYSAFLRLQPGEAVISMSPERFMTVADRKVTTQPIKGTSPRYPDPEQDQASATALQKSEKDIAENIMITDLLRNDLGRFCTPGTVHTTEICALKSYANVHHLVTTITGTLRDEVSLEAFLLQSSPGGSITGAPKRRAIEIIHELEPTPRNTYCGSVFMLSSDGFLNSSIAIRTLEVEGNQIHCWGGGGITIASDGDDEYQETLDKVQGLMRCLEEI